MKRFFLMALAAVSLVACNNDEKDVEVLTEGTGLNLRIGIDREATKAIEDAHPKNSYVPKVYSAMVVAYNSSGVVIQEIDVTDLDNAIDGDFTDKDGSEKTGTGKGANIGLPAGTAKVDVVLNNSSSVYKDISANINYYNDKKKKASLGDGVYGENNFDRVFLVTPYYGSGIALTGSGIVRDDVTGYYKGTFTVAPATARFEVTEGINVAAEAEYKDLLNRSWKHMSAKDLVKFLYDNASDHIKGEWDSKSVKSTEDTISFITKNFIDENLKTVFKYGARADKKAVGDDFNSVNYNNYTYYFPQYYWQGTGEPTPFETVVATGDGWHLSPLWSLSNGSDYTAISEVIKWYPNGYYAVDVEEIYMNNIAVVSPSSQPYLHPWPGSEDRANGWPSWYKSFHVDGWHHSNNVGTNTFLCMGNMWDRIIKEDAGGNWEKVKWGSLNVPSIDGSTSLQMSSLQNGKATIESGKSKYYSTDHNIGIEEKKAAAYHFYPQSADASITNKDILAGKLPHIILKVKCFDSKESYTAGTIAQGHEFITIKLFAEDKTTLVKYVNNFKRGCIYRLNLNDLLYSFVGKAPIPSTGVDDSFIDTPKDPVEPEPELPGVRLVVGVTIQPWTAQNVYPVI